MTDLVGARPAASGTIPLDLRQLYREHAPFLRASIQRLGGPRIDADDLLHEVFVIALDRSGAFAGRSAPRTWLYGIALKVVARARQRSRLRAFLGLDALGEAEQPRAAETPDRSYEKAEARRAVYALLDRLSERKRTVFILFELEGLSGEEIAALVGCPVKTVWTRLFHARKAFLRLLERSEAHALPSRSA